MKKNIIKIISYIFLSFIIGFLFGIQIKAIYEYTFFKTYYWNRPPDIVNCYGNELSESSIYRAIHYWTVRGESLSGYVFNPTERECKEGSFDGSIVIKKDIGILNPETLATTKRYTNFYRIDSADIMMRVGSQNLDLLLEHEIGHALGYGHVEEPNHIMNPKYEKIGEKFWIP